MLAALLLTAALTAPEPVFVSARWLAEHRRDAGLVIVQLSQNREEYDRGHLPGARPGDIGAFHDHMHSGALPPAGRIVEGLERLGISNESRVVLVGDPIGAALVFVALEYVGHGGRTLVLDGGVDGWKAAGFALTTAPVPFSPGRFTPRLRTDFLATADWIAAKLADSGIRLLDARTEGEYTGSSTGEGLPRFGHIPGAIHLDWRKTLHTAGGPAAGPAGDNGPLGGLLRDRAELEALFREASAGGREVVAYCTVGMRASFLYLVARELGFRTRVYLGSMNEWSRRPELPVATGNAP